MSVWRSTVASFRQTLSNFFRCEVFERRRCRECRIAAYFEPDHECAARVHEAGDGVFGCERYRLGRRSPGPVQDSEYLNLIITDPQSLDPRSGNILPVVVNQVDKNGVSVLRDAAANDEFEITFQQMKQRSDEQGKQRFFHGVCRFLAGNIRRDGAKQQLGVYDTSFEKRRHHADMLAPPLQNRREIEARKKRIIDKISPGYIAVANFRSGAFVKYGRGPVG
jgi:hypothetical protein